MEIPKEVKKINQKLADAGFEVYLVGGCVRDFLLEKKPKDWDLTTNAKPKEIQKFFPDSVYENQFGTVGVKTGADNLSLALVEVTTFRKEGKYTDKRHPDEITFAKTVEEDLSRRDFTINALALDLRKNKVIDPFSGQKDLKAKIIRAVGDAPERFKEDALRLMRAVRFAAQLGFSIDQDAASAIKEKSALLEFIAKERIADELNKIIMTDNAAEGIRQMERLGVLKFVLPEVLEGIDVTQNKHHIYTVFDHCLKALEYAAKNDFNLETRLASLLHDVGKPRTKGGDGPNSTFYGHQVVGERMAIKTLDRLHYPKKAVERIALLIREHMFVYDPETVTLAGVRRLVRRTGLENIEDLLKLREADRIGSGVPKAQPYRLRYLKAMIEKVKKDPISAKMVVIKGGDVMEILKIEPGPKIGWILSVLLEEVLDEPKFNDNDYLSKRIKELGALNDKELMELAAKAKLSALDAQRRIDDEIKQKYFVK